MATSSSKETSAYAFPAMEEGPGSPTLGAPGTIWVERDLPMFLRLSIVVSPGTSRLSLVMYTIVCLMPIVTAGLTMAQILKSIPCPLPAVV